MATATMTKAEEAEARARAIVANAQLSDLLDEWELTTNMKGLEVAKVREWLLDELESRNPEAFNEWLDGEALDETLREYMTK